MDKNKTLIKANIFQRLKIIQRMPKHILYSFLFLIFLTICIHSLYWNAYHPEDLLNEDIFYAWKEGVNIENGVNPYARILLGNLRDNSKYPTYLPLIYLFSAFLNKIGLNTFAEFLSIWRPISLLAHIIIGTSIFYLYLRNGFFGLGLISATIIFLGRWSNYIIRVQHLEYLAIAFLILSLILFEDKPFISGVLMSGSLCVKHLAIIFLPIILISAGLKIKNWHLSNFTIGLKKYLRGLIIPVCILVTPFILNSPLGFFSSLLFPISRHAGSSGLGTGIGSILLGEDGAKIVAYILILYIYWIISKIKIPLFSSCFITLFIFLQFNSIIYTQYYFWLVVFSLLSLSEISSLSSWTGKAANQIKIESKT
tara:strand:+ start:758 stop:1861 length:1104 start_codon:yes stop_codon:yes gene_type:complete